MIIVSNDKLKILVFVPLSACSCTYENFLDRAWQTMMSFEAKIEVKTKDVNSPEGDKYNIFQNTILIVDDGTKFTSIDMFKQYLETNLAS